MNEQSMINLKNSDKVTVTKNTYINGKKTPIELYNMPCAYDIEVSSFKNEEGHKQSIIYSHAVSINGNEHVFRHNHEISNFFNNLAKEYKTVPFEKHIVIYVHNLQYEFQFIKGFFDWVDSEVFAISKTRNIVSALTTTGIEFKCSAMLTGFKLAKWGEILGIPKMVGDLDYELIRTPLTPLSELEMGYILNDIRIIIAGIREEINKNKGIHKIPLTSTGYVRRDMRQHCNKSKSFKHKMQPLNLQTPEFILAKRTFQGGFTKSNVYFTDKVLKNVRTADESSQYPSKECSELYPMSAGIPVKPTSMEELRYHMKNHACLFTITIENVESKRQFRTLSVSKCDIEGAVIIDNGRIKRALKITTSLTNVDFEMLELYYNFDVVNIGTCYIYSLDYLPKEKIDKTRYYYMAKTSYKNVEGKEFEYTDSKPKLNGLFGMSVATPVYPETSWNEETLLLENQPLTVEQMDSQLYDMNTSKTKFIFYLWGVFTTSYSRRDSLTLIADLEDNGIDVYYTDTDSVYFDNVPEAMEIIEKHNKIKQERQHKLCEHYDYPLDYFTINDPKGNPQVLGEWQTIDGEDEYDEFKTLGAKRYLTYKKEKGFALTCAGVNKKAVRYIEQNGGFDYFNDNMYIPEEHSGKLTLTYLDNPMTGTIVDYQQIPYEYNEISGIYMEPASFTLTLSDEYKQMLDVINEKNNYRSF